MTIFFDSELGDWFVKRYDNSVVRFNPQDHMHLIDDLSDLRGYWGEPQMSGEQLELPQSCVHEWRVYDSGITAYEYCAKCNQERPIS